MNFIFGKKDNNDSKMENQMEDRRRSMSSEGDSLMLDNNHDNHVHDYIQRRGSISQILLGPETGLFGTHVPETHQNRKVSLDDFMAHYNKYQINGIGFDKEDYLKKQNYPFRK
uniref:Uncharacterized protein n=1 Tax=Strongyloides stercoralis TaxID=6248 RepID=A0A0K0EJC3_STRER